MTHPTTHRAPACQACGLPSPGRCHCGARLCATHLLDPIQHGERCPMTPPCQACGERVVGLQRCERECACGGSRACETCHVEIEKLRRVA